jgi:hypothetical protein
MAATVQVYPNPSENGIFDFDISASKIFEISVSDLMGRIISTPFLQDQEGELTYLNSRLECICFEFKATRA